MKKRILSVCLALVMVLGLFPAQPAGAASGSAGTVLSFQPLEQTAYTASLGTPRESLDLPGTLTATVEEPGEDGAARVSTRELPVTWTCDGEYQLAMEGTYTFTAGAEGYALAAGVAWPTVTVTLEHRLAEPLSAPALTAAEGAVYAAGAGTAEGAGTREAPWDLRTALANVPDGGTVYVMDDITITWTGYYDVGKTLTLTTDPQRGGAATVTFRGNTTGKPGGDTFLRIFSATSGQAAVTIENLILDRDNLRNGNAFIFVGNAENNNTSGSLTLGDGAVIRNSNSEHGAVWTNTNGSNRVTIEEGAVITGNVEQDVTAGDATNYNNGYGAAVTLRGGVLAMNGGMITGNTAQYSGGGVYVGSGASFTMAGGTVSGNTAGGNTAQHGGGGVYVASGASFTMTGGAISGNTAHRGGGVAVAGGSFTMGRAASITGNTAGSGNWVGGGGVYVSSGSASLAGAVTGNHAQDGGGVLAYGPDTQVTVSGTVNSNTATYGGGVYAGNGSQVTLDGATVTGNQTTNYGAGVFLHDGGSGSTDIPSMTLQGRVTITGNHSDAKEGREENNLFVWKPTDGEETYLTLGSLAAGSSIGVGRTDGNWIPITGLFGKCGDTEAETYVNYFTSDNPGVTVETGEGGLWLVESKDYYVSSEKGDDTAGGTYWNPFRTLGHAVDQAEANGGGTIHIMDAVIVPEMVDVTEDITLTGEGFEDAALVAGSDMQRTGDNINGMLNIGGSATLSVDHLLLDGAGWAARAIRGAGGGSAVELNDGTVITNWNKNQTGHTHAVYVAHVTLTGHVEITGNHNGGIISTADGTITLSGRPVIHGNVNAAGQESNITLRANRTTDPQITVTGRLEAGSAVGVTDLKPHAPDLQFAVNDSAGAARANLTYFHADSGQEIISRSDKYLVWGDKAARVLKPDGTSTTYDTLQAAVDAAGAGDVVELLRDTDETVEIGTSFAALDWGGHTLTGSLAVAEAATVGAIRNTVNAAQNYMTGGVTGGVVIEGAVTAISGGRYQNTETGAAPGAAVYVKGSLGEIAGGWFTGAHQAICWDMESEGKTFTYGGVFDQGQYAMFGAYDSNGTGGTMNNTQGVAMIGGYYQQPGSATVVDLEYDQPGGGKVDYSGGSLPGGAAAYDLPDSYYGITGNANKYFPLSAGEVRVQGNTPLIQNWYYGFTTLEQAISNINVLVQAYSGFTEVTIEALRDIDLTEALEALSVPEGRALTVTIQSDSRGNKTYTVTRGGEVTGDMFTVNSGVDVTFKNITLDGGAEWRGQNDPTLGRGTVNANAGEDGNSTVTGFLLYLKGGSATLGAGATLQNNDRAAGSGVHDGDMGGAVSVQSGGSFTMTEGSAIRDCAVGGNISDGAAVTVWDGTDGNNSAFTMNGGVITGCMGNRWGAVRVGGSAGDASAVFTMTGGSITGNRSGASTAETTNGGVYACHTRAQVHISGTAEITGNTRADGTAANLGIQDGVTLTLGAGFTGSVGVRGYGADAENAPGAQFGLAGVGNDLADGAARFTNDADPTLTGKVSGGTLVWYAPVARTRNGDGDWQYFESLQEAVNAVDSDPDTPSYVEVLRDVTVDAGVTVKGQTFTLRSGTGEYAADGPRTLLRAVGFTGSLIDIDQLSEGAVRSDVTVADLILDGNKGNGATGSGYWGGGLILAARSTLTLEDGAVLQNNRRPSTQTEGGALYGRGGSQLNIRPGAVIRWNEGVIGAAFCLDASSAEMTGGEIYGNLNTRDMGAGTGGNAYNQNAGVVYLYQGNASFTMTGGSITGNGRKNADSDTYLWSAAGVGPQNGSNQTVTIGGAAVIDGNVCGPNPTLNGEGYYVGGTEANLVLTANATLTMLDGFTGSVGVTESTGQTDDNQSGGVFGSAAASASGAGGFTNDREPALVGTLDGTSLKWAAGAVARTGDGSAGGWRYFATLQEAVNAVTATDDIVEVLENITLTAPVAVSGKTFTLRSGTVPGTGTRTVMRDGGWAGDSDLFDLTNSAHVTVADLVVDGNQTLTAQALRRLFHVVGSTLTLADGAVLQNNRYVGDENESGTVFLRNQASLVMEDGAVIRNNMTTYGAAITAYDSSCVVTIHGGSITGNTITGRSGGVSGAVYLGNTTSLVMDGGSITGNTKDGAADNVYLTAGDNLTLTGDFTGAVGVTQGGTAENVNAAGGVFGQNGAAAGQTFAGAGGFTCDKDAVLSGSTNENGALYWVREYPVRASNDGGKTWEGFSFLGPAIGYVDDNPETESIVELLRGIGVSETFTVTGKRFTFRSGTRPEDGRYLETDRGDFPWGRGTRALLGYVPQGHALFSGTVRENLLLAAPEAGEGELWAALTQAGAEFVRDLPEGLDAPIREDGGLSQGQLQRVALARALLLDAPLLLLDEATSALDRETEALVLRRLRESGRGAVLISHHPEAMPPGTAVFPMEDPL